MTVATYPDINRAVPDFLRAAMTTATRVYGGPLAVDLAPGDVRALRIGGTDDLVTDSAVVAIDCFGADLGQASAMAEEVRGLLVPGPHITAGVVLDAVRTETGPAVLPYPNPSVFQVSATYRVSTRRTS